MRSIETLDLAGCTVLVTRPAHQARDLVQAIECGGGRAIAFPTIAIQPTDDMETLSKHLDNIADYEWLIFTSANAVNFGLDALAECKSGPGSAKIACIGAATAAALRQRDVHVDLVPAPPANSESLARSAALQAIQGQDIMIFRGHGGREWLGETLRNRGARVDYAECYRRVKPDQDPSVLDAIFHQTTASIAVTTSVEGLENLLAMTPQDDRAQLFQTPLLVTSPRQKRHAKRLGWHGSVTTTPDAGDGCIINALQVWCKRRLS